MDNSVVAVSGRFAAAGAGGHASQVASQELFDSGAFTAMGSPAGTERRMPLPVEEFGLRHLKTASEIENILHLREAIDLSVHSRGHSDFISLEKKETSAALSAHSS